MRRTMGRRSGGLSTSWLADAPGVTRPAGGIAGVNFYRLLTVPALVLLVGLYLVPLGGVLLLSVTDPEPGLGNYALLVESAGIQRMLGNTARICAITTAVALVLGYVVSYALTQSRAAVRRLMLAGVLLPLWVSVLARSFAWVALLRREGLVNTWLRAAGVIDEPLPLMWNTFGVAVGMVHTMLPYAVLAMAAQMRGIDPALTLAARGMGAGRGQAFRRVFLPLSLPGGGGAAVLVTIFSLGFYVTPALLGGGRVLMVAEYISQQILDLLRWGVGTMLATSLVVAIAGLFGLARLMGVKPMPGPT